jgi:Fe-S cluster biogenesis protein NfuA
MFIQTEPTPNPATLKFLPGRDVMGNGTADFPDAAAAARSPLASRLFAIEGVSGIFLGGDFISVAKSDEANWQVLKAQILAAIMDHFTSGQPVIATAADSDSSGEADSALVTQIKELLDTRVRPAVAQDGGDIIFRAFEDGIVYLHLQGACSGCPSSTATLKHGIENMLKYYVPEVVAVQAVE